TSPFRIAGRYTEPEHFSARWRLLSLTFAVKNMKNFVFVLLCCCSAPALATHIVGGEFEFLFRAVDPVPGRYRYNLSLILYFDKVNGSIGARDASVNIRIFRKRDNAIMRSMITLTLKDFTAVGYYKPECSTGN